MIRFDQTIALSFLVLMSAFGIRAAETAPEKDKDKDAPPASTPVIKSKYGPRDVEVKLQDGSLFRGEIKDLETLSLKTAYGPLTIPVVDMLRIERGERVSDKDQSDIAETLKDLDNDEYAKRSAAQYKLETFSIAAYETIKTAREKASPESKNRIDGILKKLLAKGQGKKVQTEDTVRTVRFEAAGALQFDTIKIKTRLGDLAVKLDDIHTIRWLNRGETKNLTLDPNTAMNEWIDTGMDTTSGDRIAVIVTGTINPFNNQEIGPTGTDNWGNNGGPFTMGAVIGKLGATGESFLLGAGKIWNTESKERLFVKIYWNYSRTGRTSEAPKGHFSVKIATGSWADEIDASAINSGN